MTNLRGDQMCGTWAKPELIDTSHWEFIVDTTEYGRLVTNGGSEVGLVADVEIIGEEEDHLVVLLQSVRANGGMVRV